MTEGHGQGMMGKVFSLPVLVRSGRKVNFWFEVLYFYCNLSDIKRTSELLHQYLERTLAKNGADTYYPPCGSAPIFSQSCL